MGYKFNVEKVTEGVINWIREWFDENGNDVDGDDSVW